MIRNTWTSAIRTLAGSLVAGLALAPSARATETENIGIRVLPAPGAVVVDGKAGDWDLSGGIFACNDCETQRDQYGVWFHAMYDASNLYLLARWVDDTPMNNMHSSKGDLAFGGDCLQFRIVMPDERCSHWTCYSDREGIDIMDLVYGKDFKEGSLRDAKTRGAAQAFTVNADRKGYVQELAIPWSLLLKEGSPVPGAGGHFTLTIEPNFTVGLQGRLSVKDSFRSGVKVDRVFTFMASPCWGVATLEAQGHVTPAPLRLSDNREFKVSLVNGAPQVDWTGLIKVKELDGFKPVAFTTPADGFVSVIISDSNGVVRHLLNSAFFTAGRHEVKWDGLGDAFFRAPGVPAPAGDYTYSALFHAGIGLKLRGFAGCDGAVPWDNGPSSGWGGDHGVPAAVATDGKRIYLGWTGAEAGKALLACDLQGNVTWHNTRGGIGGADLIAVGSNTVYALNHNSIYRVTADKGAYTFWAGTESPDLAVTSLVERAKSAQGLAARDGRLYVSFSKTNTIVVADGDSGAVLKRLAVAAPAALAMRKDGVLLALSGSNAVVSVNVETGEAKPLVQGLVGAGGLAVDAAGRIYVGDENQVKVFEADGKPAGAIGRKGGRPELGPWQREGLANIASLAVDAQGKLWVMEATHTPKRVAVWDTASPSTGSGQAGKLLKEFFGPTHYGASGGAIDPLDPNVMVGEGCEWRLDPVSGRGVCTGVIEPRLAGFARFCRPANGKLYLVTSQGMHGPGDYRIYERLGEGDYRLRARIETVRPEKDDAPAPDRLELWADANGDGQVQPGEVYATNASFMASGYIGLSTFVNTDLSICGTLTPSEPPPDGKKRQAARPPRGGTVRLTPVGFTACGAPRYDLARAESVPAAGQPSLDGRFMAAWSEKFINAYDLASGRKMWSYPNTFSGVHGSHLAPGPEMGLLRGAFGVVGCAALPRPVGAVWAFNGNCGEWYLFTQDGFFLAQLFQGDPMKVQWPEKAEPGAILDNCPPGLGGEDFGGSLVQAPDGKVYVQAGKIGLWNVEVTGLDSVRGLKGGRLTLNEADTQAARGFCERARQAAMGGQRLSVAHATPVFTGDLVKDFKGTDAVSYQKQDEAEVRSAMAWNEQFLYVGWDVKDSTPWVNGATDPAQMYIGGDTVDLQLGSDPAADKARGEAGAGDLRVSIGNHQGKPTAVLYRRVSAVKKPRTFSSGVVKEYPMDYVDVVADAQIRIKASAGKGYVVEAAIPLAALGIAPKPGMVLRGDLGATHGDAAGQRTRLRTHWSNQETGLVDDAVFELQMRPKNWGELEFK